MKYLFYALISVSIYIRYATEWGDDKLPVYNVDRKRPRRIERDGIVECDGVNSQETHTQKID